MCGEIMRISEREITEHVPGQSRPANRRLREWICPECDYFEEVDSEG